MIVVDFLFYYLWRWFVRRKIKVASLIPESQTCYVMGISFMLLLACIVVTIEFKFYHHYHFKIPGLIYVIFGYSMMLFLRRIYNTKSRKDRINPLKFKVSENAGIAIALAFLTLSVLIPLFYARYLHFLIKGMGHIPKMD